MLGAAVCDPDGIEGEPVAREPGLGLLDLDTTFDHRKLLSETPAHFVADTAKSGPWSALQGLTVHGYEIHHGRTRLTQASGTTTAVLHDPRGQALGWQQGPVLGLYLHGLFEDATAMRALLGQDAPVLDHVMDGLADFIDHHMAPGALRRLLDAR